MTAFSVVVPLYHDEKNRFNFIHTCSVMYRNGLFDDFPGWFYSTPMGDWPLHILNAQFGDIGYIGEAMGAYRIHGTGYWSTRSYVNRLKNTIKVYKVVISHLNYRYKRLIFKRIIISYWKIFEETFRIKTIEKSVGKFMRKVGLMVIVKMYRRIFYPSFFQDQK